MISGRIYPHTVDSKVSLAKYADYRIAQQVTMPAFYIAPDDTGQSELSRTFLSFGVSKGS